MDTEESLQQKFLQLEVRLLQPDVRHSASELATLLADEFVEFGSSGRVYDKLSITEALSNESAVKISVADFKTVLLASDTVLVTYRAVFVKGEGGQITHSLRSSIWKLKDNTWQMVFHQGTPIQTSQ